MNERFLELAKQAGLKFPSETALSPMEEKFAELIVRECARISVEADDTMTNQGTASAQAFMEHFGVKE
jgi:hypothetical protein